MPTVRDMISDALRDINAIGVGQTPSAENMNESLRKLNRMIGGWAARRWLVFHLVTLVKASTGAQSYTIGPGADFACAIRPARIESAFARQNQPDLAVDFPLKIITAREDYNLISLKTLTSFPDLLFYDTAWPVGTLYFWPLPTNQYSLHITIRDVLGKFASLDDSINLPPEYEEALHFNLALRLAPGFGKEPRPDILLLAKSSLDAVKTSSLQIPHLQMPEELGNRYRTYNIYGDR